MSPATAERTGVYLPRKYIPWTPFPHQTAFLSLSMDARESFTGGGVGGGKTVTLLMGALQWVEVPRYHALFLRRTIGELRAADGPIMLAHEWLAGTDAVWSENDLRWSFPSGATLTFGFLRTQTDNLQYQGAQYQTICFDELTHFIQAHYTWLFSRMRKARRMVEGVVVPSALDGVPIRMLAASNPGGPGHEWVKDRFIPDWFLEAMATVDRSQPVDLRTLVRPGQPKYGDDGQPRVFVPSLMEQNESVDVAEYSSTLTNLNALDHARFRWGDWEAEPEGNMFSRKMFRYVDFAPTPLRKLRAWDLASHDPRKTRTGGADWAAGALVGLHGKEDIYGIDVRRKRGSPAAVSDFIVETAKQDGTGVPVYIEEERGGAGKFAVQHFRTLLPGYYVDAAPLTGSKEVRAKPVATMAGHGKIHLVRWGDQAPPWFEQFLSEAVNFPSEKAHRDQIDAFVHATSALFTHKWSGAGTAVTTLSGRRRPRKAA